MNRAFLQYLHQKLKAGNLQSIHLDALPSSQYSNRLDLTALDQIVAHEEGAVRLSDDFLFSNLLEKSRFQFKLNFNKIPLADLSAAERTALDELAKQLNSLHSQQENDYLEHGAHTFAFGYPLVVQQSKTQPEQLVKAPLLLWSLTIERSESSKNQWIISKHPEAPLRINAALLAHIGQQYNIQLDTDWVAIPDNNTLSIEQLSELVQVALTRMGQEAETQSPQLLPCPTLAEIKATATNEPQIYWSGVLGLFATPKQSIVNDVEHLLEHLDDYNLSPTLPKLYRKSLQTGVDIDPSQEQIISSLEEQEYKIIQGPPGTGKSQALTAIITNVLENEGKVLVVCEKRTALQVIYNNLQQLGLGDLAVLIDDVDRDRKTIVQQVRQVADLVKPKYQRFNDRTYASKLAKYQKLVQKYNTNHQHLLTPAFRDYNIKELVTDYLRYRAEAPQQDIVLEGMEFELSEGEYDYLLPYIEDAGDLYEEVAEAAWVFDGLGARLFTNPVYSIKNENEMFERVAQEKQFLHDANVQNLPKATQPFELLPFGESIKNEFDFKAYRQLAHRVEKAKVFWQTRYDLLLKLNQHIEHISIIRPNGFFNKVKRLSHFYQKIFTHLKTLDELQVQLDKLTTIVATLPDEVQVNTLQYSSSAKAMRLFSSKYKLLDNFWQKMPAIALQINKILYKSRFNIIDKDLFEEEKHTVPRPDDISYITQQLDNCVANKKYFKSYFSWRIFYEAAPEKVQKCLQQLRKIATPADWEAVFCYHYFYLLIDQETARIGGFHSDSKLLHKLIEQQANLQKLQKRKILKTWEDRQQNSIKGFNRTNNIKWLFNHRKNSKYSQKNSLRHILHEEFDLFTDIFPVVLVSPNICSSILPLQSNLFDVVLLDEASQLRLEDTYTALLRAKIKVISGDEHQMPPVDYFEQDTTSINLEADRNEVDKALYLAESESLLEFGNNLNPNEIHTSYLDFHYRSQHPYLIAFSNAAFYGSRLVSLPQTKDYQPIAFYHSPQGKYGEQHTNEVEAQAILSYLIEQYEPSQEGHYPSLGIATFNTAQRDRIKDLIHEQMIQDDTFRHKMNAIGKYQDWFVKSLEDVQGDERDVVLISTTFAPDQAGKFEEKFGWLNSPQGYRLLNVIITRAQQRIAVFSSIPTEFYRDFTSQIIEKGNQGKGILYAYLSYCEAIDQQDEAAIENILNLIQQACREDNNPQLYLEQDQGLQEEMADYLEKIVPADCLIPNYRLGDYVVNFVVLDPETRVPKIAIECDGAIWHNDKQAYIYDMHRQKMLEQQGLQVVRTWTMAWWPNPIVELQRLDNLMKDLLLK